MTNHPTCAVIIVTYNSDRTIHKTMTCLHDQSRLPDQIILVDSGSSNISYLDRYRMQNKVLNSSTIGFCHANNIGMKQLIPHTDYVLFLNPDAFLSAHFIQDALIILENSSHQQVGAITGPLLGYDSERDQPTGLYDSTGIFRTRYGKWYDRDQGRLCSSVHYQEIESVPAICGALMFCRKRALDEILIRDQEVFDSTFYMYKEDIDLSLRLREKGWQLQLHPALKAYHCRGWATDRRKIPRKFRLMSARNECKIHLKQRSIGIIYSLVKYGSVYFFDV